MSDHDTELSWAAGFWDGEGCCCVWSRKDCRTKTIGLFIHQSFSPECLIRFQDAVGGLGKVRRPYTKEANPNLYWTWRSGKLDEVHQVMAILLPYLSSPKRKQYEKAAKKRAESIIHLPVINKPAKEDLEQMYWVEGMSLRQIGSLIGVTSPCILKWMKKLGIPRRPRENFGT